MYTIGVAVPAFIIWGIGLPFFAFVRLHKLYNLKRLESTRNQEVYGFLYLGYLPRKYWWGLVILARKVSIMITLIWLNSISVVIQALVALLILMISIYL